MTPRKGTLKYCGVHKYVVHQYYKASIKPFANLIDSI